MAKNKFEFFYKSIVDHHNPLQRLPLSSPLPSALFEVRYNFKVNC